MATQSSDRYFRAAGGRAPLRVDVTSGAAPPRRYEFSHPFALVGAHERADLVLNSPDISRRQLYLQMIDGRVFAVNLSARVPTLFGDEPCSAGWAVHGQELRLGPFALGFPDMPGDDVAAPSANPLAVRSCPRPPVVFEMKNGRQGANRVAIDRVITLVGNDPVCKLRLNSSRVSAVHCSLVRNSIGMWVVDLASTEGVSVNGTPVRAALLGNGDVLELGGRCLEVQYSDRSDAPASETTSEGFEFAATEIQRVRPEFDGLPFEDRQSRTGGVPDGFPSQPANANQQFHDMMELLVQAFGNVFNEHRKFVDAELARLDALVRLMAEQRGSEAGAPGAATGPARPQRPASEPLTVPLPPLTEGATGDEIHAWLQTRLGHLSEKKSSLWERVSAMLRARGTGAEQG
jgi:hypothetical protein